MQPGKYLFVLVAGLLFIHTVVGFGYMGGTNTASASPGDEVHFNLFLFGRNESVKVTTPRVPTNWRVNVTPANVNFPLTHDFRYMEADTGYRKIAPIHITVNIPENAENGDHTVSVSMKTGTHNTGAHTVAVRQVQKRTFHIHIADGTVSTTWNNRVNTSSVPDGLVIQGSPPAQARDAGVTNSGSTPFWKKHVVLVILFEITWGIVAIYVLKRRDIL